MRQQQHPRPPPRLSRVWYAFEPILNYECIVCEVGVVEWYNNNGNWWDEDEADFNRAFQLGTDCAVLSVGAPRTEMCPHFP